MFTTTNTIINDSSASLQDIKLLLSSEKGQMFGDPFFGVRLKRYMFEQNNYVLRDILVDEIYTQLLAFAPQITVNRKDINIVSKDNGVTIRIKAINNLDFTTNMFELVMFQEEER